MKQEIVVRDTPPKPLSDREKKRRAELEHQIVKDFGAFFRVGRALAEIRDSKLYRETHKTFELYCKDLWDMATSNAYRLINSAQAYDNLECVFRDKNLSPNWGQNDCSLLPINEAQVRPLTKLQPDQQREVWESVILNIEPGKKITASLVTGVVKKYLGETTQTKIRQTRENVHFDQHVGADFKAAFDGLMEQIEKERATDYKTTSRHVLVRYLDQLRQIISEDGEKIEDPAFDGTASDAVKLEKAGYSLFRMDRNRKVIKIRAGGGWPDYENPARAAVGKVLPYETIKEMEADFAALMEDPMNLRG